MIKKLLKTLNGQKTANQAAEDYRNLIRYEAKIGGQLFGPVPKGSRREFFCLDEHTWVWYEEWRDQSGRLQRQTTRYDIRPNGVIKMQDGQPTRYVNLEEAQNLYQAVTLYNQRIDNQLNLYIA